MENTFSAGTLDLSGRPISGRNYPSAGWTVVSCEYRQNEELEVTRTASPKTPLKVNYKEVEHGGRRKMQASDVQLRRGRRDGILQRPLPRCGRSGHCRDRMRLRPSGLLVNGKKRKLREGSRISRALLNSKDRSNYTVVVFARPMISRTRSNRRMAPRIDIIQPAA